MFGSSYKSVMQKLLKDANFLAVHVYVYRCVCIWYVYKPAEADVSKLSLVHMGFVRPKINNAANVYWQLNMYITTIIMTLAFCHKEGKSHL